jgi:hypothetical protein
VTRLEASYDKIISEIRRERIWKETGRYIQKGLALSFHNDKIFLCNLFYDVVTAWIT